MNKLTKKQIKDISTRITNNELLDMLDKAQSGITDWNKPSDIYKNISKGKAWNMLASDFDVDKEYADVVKYRLIQEFGYYIPFYLIEQNFPKPKKDKQKEITHEEPVFKSDNNGQYYIECMTLLNDLLFLMYGNECQLCHNKFEKESLMPIHILSVGSYKRLQFVLKNIVFGCDNCHKEYDEGKRIKKNIIIAKMEIIKRDNDLIDNLKMVYNETPLLKEQKVKEFLKEEIRKYKK